MNPDMANKSSLSSSFLKPSNTVMATWTSSKSMEFNAPTYNGTNQTKIPGLPAPVLVPYTCFQQKLHEEKLPNYLILLVHSYKVVPLVALSFAFLLILHPTFLVLPSTLAVPYFFEEACMVVLFLANGGTKTSLTGSSQLDLFNLHKILPILFASHPTDCLFDSSFMSMTCFTLVMMMLPNNSSKRKSKAAST